MRKRLRKKLNRNRCPKCGGADGMIHHYQLKTGRWVKWFVKCWPCDMEPEYLAMKAKQANSL